MTTCRHDVRAVLGLDDRNDVLSVPHLPDQRNDVVSVKN